MIAAFVEADRILKYCFFLASASQPNLVPENAKLLDLKEVARTVLAEQDKRLEQSRNGRSPPPVAGSALEIVRKDPSQDPNLVNTQSKPERQGLPSLVFKYIYGVISALTTTSSKPEIVASSERLEERREEDAIVSSKKVVPESRKKVEPVKTSPIVTSRKSKVKKSGSKPKLSSQSSVNDEMDTSSTTTESSNPEELMEPFAKGIIISSTSSESPTSSIQEHSKKKKKTKTKTVDAEPAREHKAKAKKPLERTESKPERIEKTRLSPKSSSELTPKPQSSSPLPQAAKQEAKVKGVPKEETSILRRQQSAPAYSPPPRLQGHGGQQLPLRSLGDQGRSSPGHADAFQPKQDRPEPPRAIILPEMKQNPGSQFGPIGCKVPREQHLSKSTWQDSPAAPGPMQGHHDSQARSMSMAPLGRQAPVPTPLLPPPGLTIMQQLQAERRQREEEYVRRQNNWPGFGDSASSVSSHQPVGPVVTHPEVGGDYVQSLWDQPGGGQTQGQQGLWGTIGNVWPSTVFNSAGFRYQGEGTNGESGSTEEPETLTYDNLSLSSIWASAGSQQQETENNAWSSLFNNNKKDI